MKNHQIIFDKIKTVLVKNFKNEINELEDGNHLSIGDSEIWISCDSTELTIGYGINHRHYLNEKESIIKAVDDFFNLLSKRKKTTEYYKGNFSYKIKTEIEGKDGTFSELSTSMCLIFPFWKKTTKKTIINKNLLEYKKIENDILAIKNYANCFI